MQTFPRISHDPAVMGGKACIAGTRITAANVVAQLSAGRTVEELLADYPVLRREDVQAALAYAAWRLEEREFDLKAA